MAYAMLLLVCAAFCFTSPCLASVQTPTLTSCSSTQVLLISDLTLRNAKVGQTMRFNYTGQLTASLTSNPTFNFTMTRRADNVAIPCFQNVGSCVYRLCGGTNNIERQIGAPWNNQCPIAPLDYTSSVAIPIPALAGIVIGNGNLHLKIALVDGGSVAGCREFDFTIAH